MTIKNIQCSRRKVVWLALATSTIGSLSGQSSANQRTPLMDRQKEIALALSACPRRWQARRRFTFLTALVTSRFAMVGMASPQSSSTQCQPARIRSARTPRVLARSFLVT